MRDDIKAIIQKNARTLKGLGVPFFELESLIDQIEQMTLDQVKLAHTPARLPAAFPDGRWVSADYVDASIITASSLRVRKLPSTDAAEIGRVSKGQSVQVIYTTPDQKWHMIL